MSPILLFPFRSFDLYASPVILWIGILLSLWLGLVRGKKASLPGRMLLVFSALALLLGFLFSHLCNCVIRYGDLRVQYLAFWQSGSMLYGGALGCLLAAWLSAALCHGKVSALLDAFAPSGALVIVFGRIAEGLGGQGYGEYLEAGSPFARFPFAILEQYYEQWAWALFVLEAICALILFIVLLVKRPRFSGDLTLLLFGLYAALQIVCESMRRDEFLRWGFVRSSELISAVIVCVVLACYGYRGKEHRGGVFACWLTSACLLGCCMLLEFAMEQKIPFLRFLDVSGCYACMTGACLALLGCILWMRQLRCVSDWSVGV